MRSFGIGVFALALRAVSLLHWTANRFSAAVTTIEGTACVVVIVIAIAVTLVGRRSALRSRSFGIGVFALALRAVSLLHWTANRFSAAVTTIKGTACVVVIVVAVTVTLVARRSALRSRSF